MLPLLVAAGLGLKPKNFAVSAITPFAWLVNPNGDFEAAAFFTLAVVQTVAPEADLHLAVAGLSFMAASAFLVAADLPFTAVCAPLTAVGLVLRYPAAGVFLALGVFFAPGVFFVARFTIILALRRFFGATLP